jgi:hypothetical protein
MGLCGSAQPAHQPPVVLPPVADVVVVAPRLVSSMEVETFLVDHYRDVFPHWARTAHVALEDDLATLMTHPPDDAFSAMGVGYKESALKNLCNRGDREEAFLRDYCPTLDRLVPLARDSAGKGFCQFAAPWLARYLNVVHARSTGLRDMGGGLGNHAYTLVPNGGDDIVVDGTWRQFAAVLGIAHFGTCATILVGPRSRIGAVLKARGAADNEHSRRLVRFYGGNPDQLRDG